MEVQITVCADGFVSLMVAGEGRRLSAALPFFKTNSVKTALELISKVCVLSICKHENIGNTIEPRAPIKWNSQIEDIDKLRNLFEEQYNKGYQ